MENDRRVEKEIILKEKHLPRILAMGLMLSSLLIIFSVDYLYQNQEYIKLIISTCLFAGMIFIMRWLNNAK